MIQIREQYGNLYVRILDTQDTFEYTLEKVRAIPNRSYKAETNEWMFPKERLGDIMAHFENQIVWMQPLEEIVKGMSIKSELIQKHLDWQHNDDFKEWKLKPYPYQKVGCHFLADRGQSAVFDGVGLGKTPMIIGAFHLLYQQKKARRCLIITLNSIKRQWAKEVEKFTNYKAIPIYGSASKRKKLIKGFASRQDVEFMIINYETLRSEEMWNMIKNISFDMVALDEAQKIKTGVTDDMLKLKPSLNAKYCYEIRDQIPYRFLATATPIQGKPQEIWSLFHFMNPDVLGPWEYFRERYTKYHVRYGINGSQNEGELYMRIAPHFIRRTKEMPEIQQQLPRVKHDYIFLELTDGQEKLQEYLLEQIEELKEQRRSIGLKGIEVNGQWLNREQAEEYFDGLSHAYRTFLIENCNVPNLLIDEEASHLSHSLIQKVNISNKDLNKSPKIDYITSFYKQIRHDEPSSKIVLFTEYTRMAYRVYHALCEADQSSAHVLVYHGQMSDSEKEWVKEEFVNNSSIKALICTSALSTGANLQQANYMIHIDLPASPTDIEQRNGRIDRTGNPHSNIVIQYLVMSDSYEEHMLDMLENKATMSNNIVEGGRKVKSRNQDFTKLAIEKMMKRRIKKQTTKAI